MSETLGRVVEDAVRMREQMKAQGMTGAALDAGLEAVVRERWPKPKGRTEPWRYFCEQCRDYGLDMRWCDGGSVCGSNPVTKRLRGAHDAHEYGTPCLCAAGLRHLEKPRLTPEDTETKAAKSHKPTRWGR